MAVAAPVYVAMNYVVNGIYFDPDFRYGLSVLPRRSRPVCGPERRAPSSPARSCRHGHDPGVVDLEACEILINKMSSVASQLRKAGSRPAMPWTGPVRQPNWWRVSRGLRARQVAAAGRG
jgi:hypothetical protein